jgi:UDP-N-acetylmuramate dehydrogenase
MAISPKTISDIEKISPSRVFLQVPLSKISRWGIGGIAQVIIRPESALQVEKLRRYFVKHDMRHLVIGMTSNLLFADEGLDVPCIQIDSGMGKVYLQGNTVTAQAGAWVPGFARRVQKWGFRGVEHACGIPGTVGGLIYMNGGSQRRSIGENVIEVMSINSEGDCRVRNYEECEFGYRESVFQNNNEIIVEAKFQFNVVDNPDVIRKEILSILSSRRKKFPYKLPNCGSVFKSNPKYYMSYGPPGVLIENLGLKGFKVGGAEIPSRHANFIVNTGRASASDVLSLIEIVKSRVADTYKIALDVECLYVDSDGNVSPAG